MLPKVNILQVDHSEIETTESIRRYEYKDGLRISEGDIQRQIDEEREREREREREKEREREREREIKRERMRKRKAETRT